MEDITMRSLDSLMKVANLWVQKAANNANISDIKLENFYKDMFADALWEVHDYEHR